MKNGKKVANNIVMLYILNIAQLVLPLVTLPYLTRVLSVSGYSVVSYVKTIMVYVTLAIEFGFLLSGTKEIVEARESKEKVGLVVGRVMQAKLLISIFVFLFLVIMTIFIPILRQHPLYTFLSFWPPFLSIFLFDFLFRGLEQMQIVTIRFVIMKGISTFLTFILIKSERQLNIIPILDIIGSLVAALWVYHEIKKMGISPKFDSFSKVFISLRISFTYFVSDIASSAFGILNTIFVGIYFSSTDVAYWGILMSLIGAVQSMYNPISNGIYPHMVAQKSLNIFKKVLMIFIPILFAGACITFFGAKLILLIIAGTKYVPASQYLQEAVPLLVISFFSIMFGWPLLGAIGKIKETTLTTIVTAIIQILGMGILILLHDFTIPLLLLSRTIAEIYMACSRVYYFYKFRKLFYR